MSDTCSIIIAQYVEPIDEWSLLSMRSRWGGIGRVRIVADLAHGAWLAHQGNRHELALNPLYAGEFTARLFQSMAEEHLHWHSFSAEESESEHDFLILDVTNLEAFQVPCGAYDGIRTLLRARGGDRIALKDLDSEFIKEESEFFKSDFVIKEES